MSDPRDERDRNAFWQQMLAGEHPSLRRGRAVMRMLSPTADNRCRLCCVGFDGFTAPALRLAGFRPWRRNPHICEQCETVLAKERGGAEIEIAMLYADVRGSTELAARIGPTEFAALMQRFFRVATHVFAATDAVVDKMVGDEVIGIFPPGISGSDYRQLAVKAGLALLRATGHDDPAGPWLSIGVGVHTGRTFVGSIGVEDGNYQFAALGDPMNFCARLVAAAKGGEMVISSAVWGDASTGMAAERRSLRLKGYPDLIDAYVVKLAG
ncbi:adenylate/guanylate cyclase domain-containing protein [Bradyrhizobium sp. 62B]|jgi:adenylate cyclase|uniref:adenylate/guanylate cyclase domain-containing protein n=1 Tax=unclassified Bradyrhizobium TaxID=2631580 RepID=UPI001B8A167A|nr:MULTISPECIES: adenylate/guanylate cyclase domain-containing protein [Bradyrhizobium]MBR0700444.1 adenylate/guanylate cyclase domain-containing protein [Bradyrhizobium diazoefficiens]MBR0768869.1 adenylate/guanylate cyclase domain-containing protein [Bradyrhizobium diazoefficiens]MDT4742206.1 adenylate/guanylate cyclase domain-containing protein [Bradyrhizobium sp. WYCCWR 12699]WIW49204.1 adenylate/guanylate cyclase domain-containing protein [Bradyrhizobium sp. 62B]